MSARHQAEREKPSIRDGELHTMDCFSRPLTIPRLEAHPLELEVDGVGLVATSGLRMAVQREREREMRESPEGMVTDLMKK